MKGTKFTTVHSEHAEGKEEWPKSNFKPTELLNLLQVWQVFLFLSFCLSFLLLLFFLAFFLFFFLADIALPHLHILEVSMCSDYFGVKASSHLISDFPFDIGLPI